MSPDPRDHLERFRAGEGQAGADLCEHFVPAVRCLALTGTLDHEGAADVVARTLEKLLERLPEVDHPARLLPLVEELTRDEIRAWIRREGGRSTEIVGVSQEVAARASGPNLDLPGLFGELPPERAAWILLEAVSFIPAHQEVLFLLRYLEGMSYEEIAELTGIPLQEIGAQLTAARRLYERELTFHLKKVAGP